MNDILQVMPVTKVKRGQFREASKEMLMNFWESSVEIIRENIQVEHRVENIQQLNGGFHVTTSKAEFDSSTVLLAMGRRGTPRKLGVPGEELPKVVYRLVDPEQYANKKVLVVGGGDSALEAALAISKQAATVTISYRSPTFSRAKAKNREEVIQAEAAGTLRVLLKSHVKMISGSSVTIETDEGLSDLDNDDVLICAGGVLATPFLKKVGIDVEEKFGVE